MIYKHRLNGTGEVFFTEETEDPKRPYSKDNRGLRWTRLSAKGYTVEIEATEKPSEEVTKKYGGNSKRVIDTSTEIIYDSVAEAAREFELSASKLRDKLNGKKENDTNLKYI